MYPRVLSTFTQGMSCFPFKLCSAEVQHGKLFKLNLHDTLWDALKLRSLSTAPPSLTWSGYVFTSDTHGPRTCTEHAFLYMTLMSTHCRHQRPILELISLHSARKHDHWNLAVPAQIVVNTRNPYRTSCTLNPRRNTSTLAFAQIWLLVPRQTDADIINPVYTCKHQRIYVHGTIKRCDIHQWRQVTTLQSCPPGLKHSESFN